MCCAPRGRGHPRPPLRSPSLLVRSRRPSSRSRPFRPFRLRARRPCWAPTAAGARAGQGLGRGLGRVCRPACWQRRLGGSAWATRCWGRRRCAPPAQAGQERAGDHRGHGRLTAAGRWAHPSRHGDKGRRGMPEDVQVEEPELMGAMSAKRPRCCGPEEVAQGGGGRGRRKRKQSVSHWDWEPALDVTSKGFHSSSPLFSGVSQRLVPKVDNRPLRG